MNALTDKVALITGSARGLGQAIAERYAALGPNIILNYSKDRVGAGRFKRPIFCSSLLN